MESLINFDTFEEVKHANQKTMSCRWIITEKVKNDKKVFKAQLVCRGFEEEALVDAESPTTRKQSVRLFLTITAMFKWQVKSLDIKAAFLQSEQIDREIFLRPPRDIKKQGIIWRLKKPLYGLNDASRSWYFTLIKSLKELGVKVTSFDKAMFYLRQDNKLQGMINVHVDDLLLSGTGKMSDLMKKFTEMYVLSKSEAGSLRYVGIDLSCSEGSIFMSQQSYSIEFSEAENLVKNLPDSRVLDNDYLKAYQSLVGKLNWLSCNTRPDIKFDVFLLSSTVNPTVGTLKSIKKVLRKMSKGPKHIQFPRLDVSKLEVLVYTDAAFGNLDEKVRSSKAFIVFISDGERVCAVDWNTKKIDKVCTAANEAETYALMFGSTFAESMRDDLCEILGYKSSDIPVVAFVDNKTLFQTCYSNTNVSNPSVKRLVAAIQEKISAGTISKVEFKRSSDMMADVLTKKERVDVEKFAVCLENGCIPEPSEK